MKILTVVYASTKGGTERAAVNFALGYKKIGHDSRVLVTEKRGVRDTDFLENDVAIYSTRDTDLDAINQWSPDIVHVHSHRLASRHFYRLRSMLSKAQFFETNVFSRPSDWDSELKYSFQLSDWALMLYAERGGKSGVVLPYAINVSDWGISTNDYDSDPKRVIRIGRVGQSSPAKWSRNLVQTLEAVFQLTQEEIEFVFVDPPSEFQKQVLDSEIARISTIYPPISNDSELREIYNSIDIFIHDAEIGESFGMVLAEAALSNCDIITFLSPWGDNTQLELVSSICGGCANNYNEFATLLLSSINKKKKLKIEVIHEKYDYAMLAAKVVSLAENDAGTTYVKDPIQIYNESGVKLPLIYKLFMKTEKRRRFLKLISGHTKLNQAIKRRLR